MPHHVLLKSRPRSLQYTPNEGCHNYMFSNASALQKVSGRFLDDIAQQLALGRDFNAEYSPISPNQTANILYNGPPFPLPKVVAFETVLWYWADL